MMNKQDKQRASAHGACGALAISLALAWGGMPRDAVAQTAPVQISITAQPLGDALLQLGEQASLVIFYLPETVRGRYAPAVSGRLTPDDALRRLLAGTQLTFQISGNSVTIVPAAAPGGVTTLSPISVTGRVESATGPVDGMVARRSATGTKSDVSVLETPQSLSIITPDQMDVQGATNLEQTVRYTPGIRSEILGAGTERDKIYIRGFEPNYYLDGMMLPYGAAGQGSRIEPYGLERIEVLRGPSSVLYGQNPPGGIINMVSKRPTAEPLREIALEGGNFDRRQVAADFSGPIDEEGKFLYRLTALKRNSDTQVDYARDDRDYVAPSFTWKPSAATSLTVLGQYQRDDADVSVMYLPAWGTLYKNPYGDIPRDRNVDEPDHDKFKRYYRSIGYLFEHHFNDKLTVRQNLRYADVDVTAYSVYGTGLIMNPATQLPSDYRTLSRYQWDVDRYQSFFTLDNQAQAKFQTGALSHDLLLGLDYKRATLDQTVHGGVGPTIDVYNPVYHDIGRGAKVVDGYEEQHQIGLYLQDQVKLERWLLTMGGRYDWTDKTNRNRMTNVKTTSDDNVFTGRVGLTYLAESGLAPYASYSTSFEPVSGTGYGGTPFEPTKGRQYEVGVKYQPHNSNSLHGVGLPSDARERADAGHRAPRLRALSRHLRQLQRADRRSRGQGPGIRGPRKPDRQPEPDHDLRLHHVGNHAQQHGRPGQAAAADSAPPGVGVGGLHDRRRAARRPAHRRRGPLRRHVLWRQHQHPENAVVHAGGRRSAIRPGNAELAAQGRAGFAEREQPVRPPLPDDVRRRQRVLLRPRPRGRGPGALPLVAARQARIVRASSPAMRAQASPASATMFPMPRNSWIMPAYTHSDTGTSASSGLAAYCRPSSARNLSVRLQIRYPGLRICSLTPRILSRQLRDLEPAPGPGRLSQADIARVEAARALMSEQMDRDLTVQYLCIAVGLNEFKLKEGFRKLYGISPHRLLTALRMQRAWELLETGCQVAQAAYRVGYRHPANFSAAFTRFHGRAPKSVFGKRR